MDDKPQRLSRRERQVMDILYALGEATATEIHERLADPPTFSATRAVIRTLEEKGHIRHEAQGLRYVYFPTLPVDKARRSALRILCPRFSRDRHRLMAALLDQSKVTPEELASLEDLIQKAKEERR